MVCIGSAGPGKSCSAELRWQKTMHEVHTSALTAQQPALPRNSCQPKSISVLHFRSCPACDAELARRSIVNEVCVLCPSENQRCSTCSMRTNNYHTAGSCYAIRYGACYYATSYGICGTLSLIVAFAPMPRLESTVARIARIARIARTVV